MVDNAAAAPQTGAPRRTCGSDSDSDSDDGLLDYRPSRGVQRESVCTDAPAGSADSAAAPAPMPLTTGDFRDQLVAAIKEDTALHLQVLQYIAVDLNDICALLTKRQIAWTKAGVVDVLNEESITSVAACLLLPCNLRFHSDGTILYLAVTLSPTRPAGEGLGRENQKPRKHSRTT